MTTQTLTLTYAAPQPIIDPYWIRIEQDAIDDGATVAQTAAALDALFEIDACAEQPAETTPAPSAPVEQDQVAESVAEVLDLPACEMGSDGSVQTTIRVYRSHLAEPYTLRLRGGTVVETIQEEGTVTTTMEIGETTTLDYPVVSGFTCAPAPLSRVGNTLRFAPAQVGLHLSASYQSRWEQVTVRIHGIDGEPGECRALAFHHGLAAALDLQAPEIAEIDRSLCPATSWQLSPTDYQVTCYKIIEITRRCTCSGDEVGSYTTQQVVPCPNPEMRCPNNETTCMHLVGTEAMDEWVECSGDSDVPGRPGEVYALSTPAYYEDHCCKQPSVSLPQCPTKRTVYKTDLPIEYGQAYWRGIYGAATRFVPVAPPGGICGEWIVEQRIDASGCCDGVPPLVWDTTISPDTITPSSAVLIGVTGGRAPYVWEVSGSGFQFQSNGATLLTSNTNQVVLSALTGACGMAMLNVSDGCSTVSAGIRCTAGQWVKLGIIESTVPYQSYLSGLGAFAGNVYGGYRYDGDVWRESPDRRYWIGPADATGSQVGTIGTAFEYAMVASARGPWYYRCLLPGPAACAPPSGCLDGLQVIDTVVGVFDITLFKGCSPFDFGGGSPLTGTYSWYIVPMAVWEWTC